ncbi:GFA family protein [Pseudomonas mandelii]|uniref:GFA family protein n=1 Tax=Pseudomonas mandelii TaxID=75612 RepID=UPI00209ED1F9|nr:GFA family protein [Pseudomonas mandelii]MCO8309045.1 GFA family protein [Pseudomonas mandelii]
MRASPEATTSINPKTIFAVAVTALHHWKRPCGVCSICGSHLMAERLAQAHVIVRVATLDDDPKMTPQVHIWTSHNVPWLEYESIEKCPEWQV